MADNMGTWNKLSWASEVQALTTITSVAGTKTLPSITLPNIAGTIQLVRLKMFYRNNFGSDALQIEADQHIQIRKDTPGSWTNAIKIVDDSINTSDNGSNVWDNSKGMEVKGSIDVSGEVDVFNDTYEIQWLNADVSNDTLSLLDIQLELDIWFTVDSGVEAKIDTAQADLDLLTGADGATLATLQPNYAPNKVVPDAAGVAPTAVEIRQEMDANSTRLDADVSTRAPANEYDTEMARITANVATEAKQDIIDGIVDDIKQSLIIGSGTVSLLGSQTVFQTDLTDADDFWNDLQILMVSGSNAGQARRISDFVNVNGVVTVDTGFKNNVALNDTFILIGRFTSAASALTPSTIATAVWSEVLPGSFTGSQAGKIIADIGTRVLAFFNKIPSKAYIRGTADADGGMDTEDKADINAEADQALVDYDPPTHTEMTNELATTESNIRGSDSDDLKDISDQLDLVYVDTQAIDGRLPTDPADQSQVEAAITASEAAIRGSDSDDLKDLSDQMDGLSAQVGQIQNNVFFSTTVLPSYERPASGSSIIKIIAQVFDNTGNPEDPDSNELKIKLDGSVTGSLIAQTNMTRDGVGVYSYLYTIQSSDNLENWEFEFYYLEGAVAKYHYRNSRLQDYSDDLDDIRLKVNANYVKLDAVTPSPTIPAQIVTHDTDIKADIATHDTDIKADILQHDVDNKALQRVKASPDLMYVPAGRTQIDLEGGITDVAVEIPVVLSDNLLESGIVKMENEYALYDGIIDSKLQVTLRGAYGTSNVAHADGVVVSQSILFPLRLTIKDNEGNMKAPDSAPTVEIDDWNGTQELAPTAMTLISTGLYGYNYIIDNGELPENKIFTFTTVVDSITAVTPHEVVIIDQIASSNEVAEGGLGEFVIDQDGWYDNDGIKTLWTDVMKGFVKDADTGAPLDDAYVTAYVYENGETKYNGRPPGQARTRPNGTWLMYLDSGDYTFVVQDNGFRIVGEGIVNRRVD